MIVVCRPYRIEETERDLLFRVRHGRRLSVLRLVLAGAGVSLLVAVLLSLLLGRVFADATPVWAEPASAVPSVGWVVGLGLALAFARRMDAAAAKVAPMPEQTVTVAPDGVRVETAVSVTDWRWTAWARFHDLPEALMLEEPGGAMVILPDRAFPDAAARAAVRETLAAHLPSAEAAAKT